MYITQCLIAKNEEANIEHCLSHLKTVVDEQIVIDTGSTDRTVELAEIMGAKVFHFDWINDFSAARNFALDKAKGDWIIFLDCDEYFSEDSVPLIRKCIKKFGRQKEIEGLTTNFINIKSNGEIISAVKNVSARIFKRKSYLRYKNKIHEVLVNVNKTDDNIVRADISDLLKIYHTGYDKTIVNEKNKNERNFQLLERELKNSYNIMNGVMKVDKRKCDDNMIDRMYDIIELIYILNRLTNKFCEDEHSKQCLLDMMDNMQNVKYSYDKYRGKCGKRNLIKHECHNYCTKDRFIDKIIFYLKSLNEE
jgi:glycosyltransferase involved in cell wall biosynthesis